MKSGNFRYEFRSSFVYQTEDGHDQAMTGTYTGLFVATAKEAHEHLKEIKDEILKKYPNARNIKVREIPKEAVAIELSLELSHLRKVSQSFGLALKMACQDWVEGKPVQSMDPTVCAEQMLRQAYKHLMPGAFKEDSVIVGPDGHVPLQAMAAAPEGQQVTLQ